MNQMARYVPSPDTISAVCAAGRCGACAGKVMWYRQNDDGDYDIIPCRCDCHEAPA